jgi:hypothetical protein
MANITGIELFSEAFSPPVFFTPGGVGMANPYTPHPDTIDTIIQGYCIPAPAIEVLILPDAPVNRFMPPVTNFRRTPVLEFSTAVDGIPEARPTAILCGTKVFGLPVNQPSVERIVPTGVPIEIIVYGRTVDKRTEVWGPYNINRGLRLSFSAVFPNGQVNTVYSAFATVTGAVSPAIITYSGEIPPGMDFIDGELSGIPTQAGTWDFCLTLTEGRGAVRYVQTSVTIDP